MAVECLHFWHRLDLFCFVGLIFVAKQRASFLEQIFWEVGWLAHEDVADELLDWAVLVVELEVEVVVVVEDAAVVEDVP